MLIRALLDRRGSDTWPPPYPDPSEFLLLRGKDGQKRPTRFKASVRKWRACRRTTVDLITADKFTV